MRTLLGVVILALCSVYVEAGLQTRLAAASALPASAQTPGTPHENPYADADIAYGFQIYTRQSSSATGRRVTPSAGWRCAAASSATRSPIRS